MLFSANGLLRITKIPHPIKIKIIPGITAAGGTWSSHQNAKIAQTGTSKNTINETTVGETLFNVKLNIVCPITCAPRNRKNNNIH